MVAYDEALHTDPFADDLKKVLRTRPLNSEVETSSTVLSTVN